MGNCLITKLKGNTNNDSLPKFKTMRVELDLTGVDMSTIPTTLRWIYMPKATFTCVNGKTFDVYNTDRTAVIASNVSTYTHTGSDWFNVNISRADDYIFEISDKYTLAGFGISSVLNNYTKYDISQFGYCERMTELSLGTLNDAKNTNVTGTLKNISLLLTKLDLGGLDIIFELSEVEDCVGLTQLFLGKTLAYGSIEDLGKLTALTLIKAIGVSGVTGDIVNLCDAMVDNGRVSGTLAFQLWNTHCTIDGESYDAVVSQQPSRWYAWAVFNSSVPNGYTIVYQSPT